MGFFLYLNWYDTLWYVQNITVLSQEPNDWQVSFFLFRVVLLNQNSGGGGGVLTSGLSILKTLPLVPSTTWPHPTRGEWCLNVYSCLPYVVRISNGLYSATLLASVLTVHNDSPDQFDSTWTWSNAHMRSESPSKICKKLHSKTTTTTTTTTAPKTKLKTSAIPSNRAKCVCPISVSLINFKITITVFLK